MTCALARHPLYRCPQSEKKPQADLRGVQTWVIFRHAYAQFVERTWKTSVWDTDVIQAVWFGLLACSDERRLLSRCVGPLPMFSAINQLLWWRELWVESGTPVFSFFPTPEMKRIDGWGGQSTAGAISGVPVPAPPNHRKLLVQSDPTTTVHGCKLVASIHFGTFAYAKEAYLSKRSRFFSMVVLQLVHLIPYRDLSERADMLLMEKLSCTIWYLHVHSLAVLQLPARQGRAPGSRAVGLVCCGMQRSEGLKIRTIKISLFMDLRM